MMLLNSNGKVQEAIIMSHKIDLIAASEYPRLIEIWEASVRATHHFLLETDIQEFKPLILNEYLQAVTLRCIRNQSRGILGFIGVAEQNLEMLFIHPDHFGKGLGKALLDYSIQYLNVTKVDVNEQNPKAVNFYKHCGFKIMDRSELDASGKPYPILHMNLK